MTQTRHSKLVTSLTRNSHSSIALVPPLSYTPILLHVTHLLCPTFLVKGLNASARSRSEPRNEEPVKILTCLRVI